MATAALSDRRDQIIFSIPADWVRMPDTLLKGLCWWEVVRILLEKRREEGLLIISPLENVEIIIVRSAEDLRTAEMRCDCQDCSSGWGAALVALEAGEAEALAIGYYQYREVVTADEAV